MESNDGDNPLLGLTAPEATDWARLHHAYGRATDTPGHLRALLGEDRKARDAALEHLWSAIIHQGTPWTATEPAARVVAGLLAGDRVDPVRAELLAFLVSVAEAAALTGDDVAELERAAARNIDSLLDAEDDEALYEDEEAANAFFARAVLGCLRAAPVLMETMRAGLEHGDPRVRAHAAMGAVTLARTEALRAHAGDLQARLLSLARVTQDSDERCAHVLALGELGYSPTEFLADPSPAVRLCAALAPSLATDPAALSELLQALERDAGGMERWFVAAPPQFSLQPRFAVVARLVEQVKEFERLLPAALAVVGITSKYCVDYDWGPLLAAAFPDGSGLIRTEAQRRFLGALVERKALWDPYFANPSRWFRQAGLPYDRRACARRVREAQRR